jgi:putative phosphoesterase
MRIAILSDIHDNVWKLAAALDAVKEVDALICCGDLCSPFIVDQIAGSFSKPVHIVFGNNDGDLFRITQKTKRYGNVQVHGEFFQGEFNGKRIAANHYDNIAGRIAKSGEFDVVCYGHNHVHAVGRSGRTLMINPGPLMGATFAPDGSRTDVASTFVIYDTETGSASSYQVAVSTAGTLEVRPFS